MSKSALQATSRHNTIDMKRNTLKPKVASTEASTIIPFSTLTTRIEGQLEVSLNDMENTQDKLYSQLMESATHFENTRKTFEQLRSRNADFANSLKRSRNELNLSLEDLLREYSSKVKILDSTIQSTQTQESQQTMLNEKLYECQKYIKTDLKARQSQISILQSKLYSSQKENGRLRDLVGGLESAKNEREGIIGNLSAKIEHLVKLEKPLRILRMQSEANMRRICEMEMIIREKDVILEKQRTLIADLASPQNHPTLKMHVGITKTVPTSKEVKAQGQIVKELLQSRNASRVRPVLAQSSQQQPSKFSLWSNVSPDRSNSIPAPSELLDSLDESPQQLHQREIEEELGQMHLINPG